MLLLGSACGDKPAGGTSWRLKVPNYSNHSKHCAAKRSPNKHFMTVKLGGEQIWRAGTLCSWFIDSPKKKKRPNKPLPSRAAGHRDLTSLTLTQLIIQLLEYKSVSLIGSGSTSLVNKPADSHNKSPQLLRSSLPRAVTDTGCTDATLSPTSRRWFSVSQSASVSSP